MSDFRYSLTEQDGVSAVSVYYNGELKVATNSHPSWDAIVAGARNHDPAVIALFDPAQTASARFEKVSDRVSIKGGTVYLDGDPVDSSLTKHIVAFIREDNEDWEALVKFMENVAANPNEHSRTQLYDWLTRHDFPINSDGNIVAYKSVYKTDTGFRSCSSGKAIVDGEEVKGQVPQAIGSVVEMPRSAVQHDPSVGCHTGLHAGTWTYASGFSGDTILAVEINPRDVVSVPTDCDSSKVRVCRYKVLNVIDAKFDSSYYNDDDLDDDFDEDDWDEDEDVFDDAPVYVSTPFASVFTIGGPAVWTGQTNAGRPTDKNYLGQHRDASGRFIKKG